MEHIYESQFKRFLWWFQHWDHLRVSIVHYFFSYKFLRFSLMLLLCEDFQIVLWTFWILLHKSLDPIIIFFNVAHFVFAVRSAWLGADHKFRPASCGLWFPHEFSFHSLHSVIWIHLTLARPLIQSLTLAVVHTMIRCSKPFHTCPAQGWVWNILLSYMGSFSPPPFYPLYSLPPGASLPAPLAV